MRMSIWMLIDVVQVKPSVGFTTVSSHTPGTPQSSSIGRQLPLDSQTFQSLPQVSPKHADGGGLTAGGVSVGSLHDEAHRRRSCCARLKAESAANCIPGVACRSAALALITALYAPVHSGHGSTGGGPKEVSKAFGGGAPGVD